MDIEVQKSIIEQNIKNNLHITDITPHSKISQLVTGFVNEAKQFNDYTDNALNNMYIETASDEFLDKAGAQEGMYRNRMPTMRLYKHTELVNLIVRDTINLPSSIPRGTIFLITEKISLKFVEEIKIEPKIGSEYPISVDIIYDPDTTSLSYISGSIYEVSDNLAIKINTNLIMPRLEEDVDQFRSRLLYSKLVPKHGSVSAIDLAVASNYLIDTHYIDYSTYPYKVYIFNNNLLVLEGFDVSFRTTSIPMVEQELEVRKSFGTEFEIVVPSRVVLRIFIKSKKDNPRPVSPHIYSFREYITENYTPMEEFVLTLDSIKDHLLSYDANIDFLEDYDVELIKNYQTYNYVSPDNKITLTKDEYPYLLDILEL